MTIVTLKLRRPGNQRLTYELLTKFSNHTLPIHRCSNTKSPRTSPPLTGQVSEPQTNSEPTAAGNIRTLIDNQISHRWHRYLKLANTSRAFCMREGTSLDIRPTTTEDTITQLNKSIYLTHLFICRNKVRL